MFKLFRRNNCLYNESIEPHCAYCSHCKPDNEYQGVCEFRGIVAMAGSCRRFSYDALRRKPPKPAKIRGRFTADDFFFEENEPEIRPTKSASSEEKQEERPLLRTDDLSQFADLWEDDDEPISVTASNKEKTADAPETEKTEESVENIEEETQDDESKKFNDSSAESEEAVNEV